MPIREYYCEACEYEVESFLRSIHAPNPTCVNCGRELKIKISKCNFKLRGIGWAADGYSKDIDDVEETWAKDGQPVGPHVKGKEYFYEKKNKELVNQLNKVL